MSDALPTCTPWPYRGRPQPDELFSSWFLRAAHAMMLKPYSLGHASWRSKPPPLTRDIDGSANEQILALMAHRTVTPIERCRQTLLSSYTGYLFEEHQPVGRTAWIMPVGVRARTRMHPGLQYCPACLDDRPYFRRLWRIAWATVCVDHGLRLLDRCSHCMAVLAPLRARTAFTCHACGVALADNPRQAASRRMVAFQVEHERILDQGWAQLGGSCFPYSVQYFETLRHLAKAIASGPRSAGFRSAIVERWGGDAASFAPFRLKEIEGLQVADRYRLFDLVARILPLWPERFVEAAKAARLWRSWALRDDNRPPFVYADLITTRLACSPYKPSAEEVVAAAAYLRRRSPGFPRQALIDLVGDSNHVAPVFEQERRRRRRLLARAIKQTFD